MVGEVEGVSGWERGVMMRCGVGHLNQSLREVDCTLCLPVTAQAQGTLKGRAVTLREHETRRSAHMRAQLRTVLKISSASSTLALLRLNSAR